MARIFFGDFRVTVLEHVREIRDTGPESHSIEWFLLRYLNRILKTLEEPVSPGQVEGSMRGLIRFYVDNLEENSAMAERCIVIYEEYRRTLREKREED